MRVFVFVSKEQAELYSSAKRLVEILNQRHDAEARLIDKLSSSIDDLLLVAKYGVVETAVAVLVDDSGVRGRLTQLPDPDSLVLTIKRLQRFVTLQA